MANPSYLALTTMRGKILAATQLAGTAATTVYTVPANSTAKIAHGTICNTSGSAVTVSVSVVPSGGAASAANRIISGYSLAAGDTLSLADYLAGAMLGEGEFISVTAGTAGALTVVLTGAESAA